MPVLICPDCGAENDLTAESCQACGASLLKVIPSTSSNSPGSEQDDLDVFSYDDHDLPELLNALKQEGDLQEGENDQAGNFGLPEEAPGGGFNFGVEEENIPAWLKRIRERARKERDSIGDITQKLEAAREHLDGDKSAEEHGNYESWIQHLHGQEFDKGAGVPDENSTSGKADSDWLSKIKKAQGKHFALEGDAESSVTDREGDSLLQWLIELEDQGAPPEPLLEAEEQAVREQLSQDALPAPIAQDIADPDATQGINRSELQFELPEITVSREEQAQADQLAATIVDERATRSVREPERRSFVWLFRLILGLLLIAGLSFSLLTGGNAVLPQGLLQPQNEALLRWAEGMQPGASLLLVVDYAPGYASELTLVAQPILESVIQQSRTVTIITSSASGDLLAYRMMEELGGDDNIDNLVYMPVAAYGAYDMASQQYSAVNPGSPPELRQAWSSGDFDGELILSDSYEGARTWIEQLSVLFPETPLNLLVTAGAGPMLLPYWESGQVTGMLSGISEAAGVEEALSQGKFVSRRWSAYQMGVLMLIALLVIGVIFNLDSKAAGNPRGER